MDKYTFSNEENDYTKLNSGRNSRQGEYGRARESLNSFDETSVKNSQSGTTDGSNSNPIASYKLNNHGSVDNVNQRETLHSRFDFVKVLGKGTYGKVKLANDKRTGKQVAIKIIHKNRIENKQDLARVRREIEFMSRLNHPHIVKILEAIKLINKSKINVKPRRLERIRREIDFMANINHPHIIKIIEVYESSEKIILVMENASGGELYDYLNERKRVSEVEARGIFRQIVSAVHFLHKNRIVHRDLKLENILIDSNGDIKLADFGLSNNWSPNNLLYTFCGSPLYASPEIVNGFPYFGPEVDCWSLGVLLYTLVYGSMPFQGGDYNRLVKQITEGQFIVPRERSGAFGLIKKCLCTKAAKRASIDDIAEHWWVNVGYAYPPVVFYSYMPGSSRQGVQALGYEGSPKVSPSIQLTKKNSNQPNGQNTTIQSPAVY
ncbi:unnamed protein product [Brachionus calyciflorus]|uniref:Protein kinase domain-containing protein n=1 Tax=Brachionus calyciflorus TaxID=104777 RepID=A0A814LKK5_9BILA|nr:unnamed protein product [Brachionus calyciflorus]